MYPLQNHPGNSRYPIETFSWHRFNQLSFARRAWSLTLIIMGLIFVFAVGGPIMIALGIFIAISGTSRLKREQKKYYSLSNMKPLTTEQLEALQIGTI